MPSTCFDRSHWQANDKARPPALVERDVAGAGQREITAEPARPPAGRVRRKALPGVARPRTAPGHRRGPRADLIIDRLRVGIYHASSRYSTNFQITLDVVSIRRYTIRAVRGHHTQFLTKGPEGE
jgi:hypothetical protein